MWAAPRSKPKEEGDAAPPSAASSGKSNPFGSAKAREARPDDYLADEKAEEKADAPKKEESRQAAKPKSNPFGAAKPVTVKYGDLDEAPPPKAAAPAAEAPADAKADALAPAAEALTIS